MFNVRLFKEQLKHNLDAFESRFLIRTFLYSAAAFFSVGFLLIFLLLLDELFGVVFHPFFAFSTAIVSFVSMFWFFSCYFKYREAPITTEKSHINKTYTLLISSYIFVFLFLFSFASLQLNLNNILEKSLLVGFIFGTTVVVYSIPAMIGLYIQKHKTILNLMQFLKYCYAIYFCLFVVFIIGSLIGGAIVSFSGFLLFLVLGFLLFSAPILTMYRLKNTVPYIDYTNPSAVYKWEMFFILEILLQLLQLAVYILRILVRLLGTSKR